MDKMNEDLTALVILPTHSNLNLNSNLNEMPTTATATVTATTTTVITTTIMTTTSTSIPISNLTNLTSTTTIEATCPNDSYKYGLPYVTLESPNNDTTTISFKAAEISALPKYIVSSTGGISLSGIVSGDGVGGSGVGGTIANSDIASCSGNVINVAATTTTINTKDKSTTEKHKGQRRCCCSCFQSKKISFWTGLLTNLGICSLLLAYTLLGSFIFLTIENDDALMMQQRTLASTIRQSLSSSTSSSSQLHRQILNNNTTMITATTRKSQTITESGHLPDMQTIISDTMDVRQRTIENIWDITVSLNILYKENWTKLAALEIAKFQDQLIKKLNEDAILDIESSAGIGNTPATGAIVVSKYDQKTDWNFAKAFLYSLTILTTIGYGNFAPRTTLGRLVTLGYAMLGIPLTLLYLSSTGGVLAKVAREVFSRALCCCLCSNCGYCCYDEKRMAEKERRMKKKRQLEEMRLQMQQLGGSNNEPYFVQSGQMHGNFQSPDKHIQMPDTDSLSASDSRVSMHGLSILAPILLCLSMMIIYIVLGALALYRLENWPILDGIYFCFMSLSTIGFGELMPGSKKESNTTTWFCSFYIMSGMALTAMCFNVVHEEIVSRLKVVVEFKTSELIKDKEDLNYYLPP